MINEDQHAFTNWVYNRYIEACRKSEFQKEAIYWDVLSNYISMALAQRKFSGERRYAKQLLKEIETANKKGTVNKLLLVGEEGKREFEKAMESYEQSLREIECSEEFIKELVINKRMNYGND